MAAYAHPELLVEPDWLAAHLNDPNVRVIDCAVLEAYRRAHIPERSTCPSTTTSRKTARPVPTTGPS